MQVDQVDLVEEKSTLKCTRRDLTLLKHVHEEMLLLQQGTLDVTLDGKTTRLTPGSVAYVASNHQHGWKNPGSTPTQYFVIAFGRDDA